MTKKKINKNESVNQSYTSNSNSNGKINIADYLFGIFLFIVMLFHLVICPFTKVEESFNLQAIHDIIHHGISNDREQLASYDHLEFPGVIPRTFIGSLLVSAVTVPIKKFFEAVISDPEHQYSKLLDLFICRGVLGLFTSIALFKFQRAISWKFGRVTGYWFSLITLTQFHLMFYMTRTLPNTFAMVPVLFALANWLRDKTGPMVVWLTIAIFIFRSEVLVLAGPIVLCCLVVQRNLSFGKFILLGIVTAVLSVATSVGIDSYFWRRWLYPEGEVFLFNTVENKSSEWGTSPFYWYFLNALPKTLALSTLLFFAGIFYEGKRVAVYIVPVLVFVGLYSILPHKELRFIFYSIPVINMVSSLGAYRLTTTVKLNRFFKLIVSLGIVGIIVGNFLLSMGFLYVSSFNYPGGYSFISLHSHLGITDSSGLFLLKQNNDSNHQKYKIHIDNLAAITGVSRFGEVATTNQFEYSKKERDVILTDYTHIIAPNTTSTNKGFIEIDSIDSYSSIKFSKEYPYIQIINLPSLYIMENDKYNRK
ncbi:hypothetical protein DICPUDRAFT_80121 [Dictyostelium purpureum]|uniref:Mannosyltransferase n=1 Tax=Dictyostelium purpureum TaxID=5786 RepID=F0ZPL4_DICPU|nr:uncharacterized protein DICPUDRAFT_80121 [Dictyostelium purpureum]EGC34106.1 hypothetical protein DICPUDRAFT_80121 [Dictyostelium purpureum]|eukprot:XP_003289352.1 hypothetical protein DICPUDRAFT_80121 [Dictyostelium purpureum]